MARISRIPDFGMDEDAGSVAGRRDGRRKGRRSNTREAGVREGPSNIRLRRAYGVTGPTSNPAEPEPRTRM